MEPVEIFSAVYGTVAIIVAIGFFIRFLFEGIESPAYAISEKVFLVLIWFAVAGCLGLFWIGVFVVFVLHQHWKKELGFKV